MASLSSYLALSSFLESETNPLAKSGTALPLCISAKNPLTSASLTTRPVCTNP